MGDDGVKLGLAIAAVIFFGATAGILIVLLVKYGKLRPDTNLYNYSTTQKIVKSIGWAAAITLILLVCSYALAGALSLLGERIDAVGEMRYFFWLLHSAVQFFGAMAAALVFRELTAGHISTSSKTYKTLGIAAFVVVFALGRAITHQIATNGPLAVASVETIRLFLEKEISAAMFPFQFFRATLINWAFPFEYAWGIIVGSGGNQFVISDSLPEHAALLGIAALAGWGLSGIRDIMSNAN